MEELQVSILLQKLLKRCVSVVELNDSVNQVTIKKEEIVKVLKFVRFSQLVRLSQLLDIFGVDDLKQVKRFLVMYYLINPQYNYKLGLRVHLSEQDQLESVASVFSSASWLEREVWDMYGVYFYNHSDLRRILTDYGFVGHPMRKDFPLTGYSEARYDEETKLVVFEPLTTIQEFRFFYFQSPWSDRQ